MRTLTQVDIDLATFQAVNPDELARAVAYANYFDKFVEKLAPYEYQNLPVGRVEDDNG